MKNIVLVGLGPHAQRVYYPFLESRSKTKKDINITLVVDLKDKQEQIASYLKTRKLQPARLLFLDTKTQINPKKINSEFAKLLKQLHVTHAIVATEPKAHKVYLETFIRAGIPVLVDKPITSPTGLMNSNPYIANRAIKQFVSDSNELANLSKKYPTSRVLVQCQRRNHEGYKLVLRQLNKIVSTYKIPITYINIHHSDGMWNMPDELFSRENHPYKYGYGKLQHSGYHFVDLLCQIASINDQLENKRPDQVSIFNQFLRPLDHFNIINSSDYKKLLGEGNFEYMGAPRIENAIKKFGELDSYSQIQYKRGGRVVTTAQMSLIQSGFSQRAWPKLPTDTYKDNGRVRHESVNIHIGPLLNIQVHSYQESQIKDKQAAKESIGGRDHFDIYIFKNSNLLGGKSFELIEFGKMQREAYRDNLTYLGHNEHARQLTIQELLDDAPSNSSLETHLSTVSMMAALFKNQVKQQRGLIPYCSFNINQLTGGIISDD